MKRTGRLIFMWAAVMLAVGCADRLESSDAVGAGGR